MQSKQKHTKGYKMAGVTINTEILNSIEGKRLIELNDKETNKWLYPREKEEQFNLAGILANKLEEDNPRFYILINWGDIGGMCFIARLDKPIGGYMYGGGYDCYNGSGIEIEDNGYYDQDELNNYVYEYYN